MTSDAPASYDTQERFTPEERRQRLRAFADRMLERLGDLYSPQDGAELEQMTRAGLLIERIYARVDAAERAAPKRLTPQEVAQNREDFGLKLAALREKHEAVCAKLPPIPSVDKAIDRLRAHGVATDWADDFDDDKFEGYDFDDGLDDDIAPEDISASAVSEPESKAIFKAACQPRPDHSHNGFTADPAPKTPEPDSS